MIKNINISIPIGIIDVLWDYDDYNTTYKCFYEFYITKINNKFEFINKFYFSNDNNCTRKEECFSNNLNISLLEYSNNIKINCCGDILIINKKQYEMLNNFILKNKDKYNFSLKYENKSKLN